jgi:hypothetical protein
VIVVNEVLISFFDRQQDARAALAAVEGTGRGGSRRSHAALVSRSVDGAPATWEPPLPAPIAAFLGVSLGALVGSWGGEAGLVIGLFFGLYAGLFVEAWRVLRRGDLLDEIQDGLAPGQAAVASFVPKWWAPSIERRFAALDAVTVHRFPGTPIEADVAREAAAAIDELDGSLGAGGATAQGDDVERERRIAAARRRLHAIEAIADRLLRQERAQLETDVDILRRELDEATGWRAERAERRMSEVRASHERSERMLEASRRSVCAASALAQVGPP